MTISRRTILGAGVGLSMLPAWARGQGAPSGAPLVVNTYGGRWQTFWREQLIPKLQASLNNQPVTLEVGLGGAWLAAFRAAGRQAPPFPCLMTNERYAVLLRQQDFFAPLPAAEMKNLKDVAAVARYPGDVAVTGMISPFGIAYRKDLVKNPPKSWKDLWNPAYRGQIGFYSIDNSASPMLIMLAGKLFGSGEKDIETGIRKIAELKPFPQAAFSGQLSPMLAQGQVSIAPIDYGEAYALQKKGVPLELVVPEDGVLMYDQAFNLAATSPQRALAAQYVDFMLSPEIQLMLAREFYVAPVNRNVVVPEELRAAIPVSGADLDKIMKFDWQFVAANAETISRKWSEAI
jgi:putative spermidine/putrescine transport system substrate-binding protein